MKVLTKFHGNPSSSCWDISLKPAHAGSRGKHQGSVKVSTSYPLTTINVCIIFFASPFSRCWDIHRISKNFTLLILLEEKLGSPNPLGSMNPWLEDSMSWQCIQQLLKYFSLHQRTEIDHILYLTQHLIFASSHCLFEQETDLHFPTLTIFTPWAPTFIRKWLDWIIRKKLERNLPTASINSAARIDCDFTLLSLTTRGHSEY